MPEDKDRGKMKIRVDEAARNTWLLRVGDGRRSQHNTSELLGRHPFRNTLPEPPMDPKFPSILLDGSSSR